VALILLALYAIWGHASEGPFDLANSIFSSSSDRAYIQIRSMMAARQLCSSPSSLLQIYLAVRINPPPIAAVLDTLSDKWSSTEGLNEDCNLANEDERRQYVQQTREKYNQLFNKIEIRLQSLAAVAPIGDRPLSIDYTILPADLRPGGAVNMVPLPPEVVIWVSQEHTRIEQKKLQASLIDTFLLLTVIGAFGSLIFLTRDYMMHDEERGIAAYVFRPMLGIFLAMAIFTLDVLAHAILSTASILEIRHEPLYVLALAAGLLSEQAYAAIRFRAEGVLEKYREEPLEEAAKRHQESGQTSQSG
jgi:hypothetical protein